LISTGSVFEYCIYSQTNYTHTHTHTYIYIHTHTYIHRKRGGEREGGDTLSIPQNAYQYSSLTYVERRVNKLRQESDNESLGIEQLKKTSISKRQPSWGDQAGGKTDRQIVVIFVARHETKTDRDRTD